MKRIHDSAAERSRAHREREARRGRVRLEITVSEGIAKWLRIEARERNKTIGALVADMVADAEMTKRTMSEIGPGGFDVIHDAGAKRDRR